MDDCELLQAYVEQKDQRAFRALVDRHIDLVYSAARRHVHDAHLAEDVSQAVFTILARKAALIRSGAALGAWLLATTRFVARDLIKSQKRRARREQQAAQTMSQLTQRAESSEWEQIEPLLDDALARLRERDRVLVTLRFLQGMNLPAVAAATGLSTQAAQKRLERAINKLRESFARRGVTLSAAAIPAALAHAIVKAPPGIAQRAADVALSVRSVVPLRPWQRWRFMRHLSMPLAAAGASIAVVVTVTVALAAAALSRTHPGRGASLAPAPPAKIKVGVILSEFTATGWHGKQDSPFDITHQKTIAYLRSPQLDLYAVLEPGPYPTFQAAVQRLFPTGHIVDAADANALRQLEVIVAGHNWHMRPEVLDAIHDAVRGGVGILQQAGFAMLTPSFTPQVCDLVAMEDADYFWHYTDASCRVVQVHPILQGLKVGDELSVRAACGAIGPLRGQPLVAAFDLSNETEPDRLEYLNRPERRRPRPATMPSSSASFADGPVFCPVYVGELGKGRIVACQWHDAPPLKLDPKHDGTFYLRCIQWLAHRPVE